MDKLSVQFLAFCLLALLAGGLMALQPPVNSRLASQCSHPLQASVISFGTGCVALIILGSLMKIGLPSANDLSSLPPWAWTGGLIGCYMVTVSLLVAPELGATRWIALVLAGQIAVSLYLDHFGLLGFVKQPINWIRVLGLGLVIAGVILVLRK